MDNKIITVLLAGNIDKMSKKLEECFTVISENNGRQAVQTLRENAGIVDVVILDLMSFDVLAEMRADEELSKIPVIAVTPENSPESCKLALELGAADFVSENTDKALLAHRVKSVLGLSKAISEVSESKRTDNTSQLKSLLNDAPSGISIAQIAEDGSMKTLYINKCLSDMLGYPDYETGLQHILSSSVTGLEAEDALSVRNRINEAYESGEQIKMTFKCRSFDGREIWLLLSGHTITDNAGEKLFYSMVTDISAEKEREKELCETAYIDPLTGCRNRAAFIKKASELLEENPLTEYTMMKLNVGNFRIANNSLGKTEGDKLLKTIANALSGIIDESGVFARFYADRFAIMTPYSERSVHPQSIVAAVENAVVKNCAATGELCFYMGVYKIDDRTLSIEEMAERASIACRSVSGGMREHITYFDEKMQRKMLEEELIGSECYRALHNKEFCVYFQPIYGVKAKKFVCAEALARWNHPKHGTILPEKFLPIFEKNGFITELDLYVLEQACAFQKKRADEGLGKLPMSVNISRTSLYNPSMFDKINATARKYKVEPKNLRIEVKESVFTDNSTTLIETIKHLRSAGYPIVLDGFGGGASSMNTLKKMPFDVLKLDMKFMEGFEKNGKIGAIITSLVRTGKWLNAPLLAEGVETREQFEFLESIGCGYIQGYYFARPVPEDEFTALLAENRVTMQDTAVENYEMDVDINKIFGNDSVLSKLIGSIFGGFGIYEFTGDKLEVIRVNEEYYNLMGYAADNRYLEENTNVWEQLFPDDVEISKNACIEAAKTGRPVRAVCRRYKKNGDIIYLDSIHRRIGGTDKNPIICISLSDITEKVLMEQDAELANSVREAKWLEREKTDSLLRKTVRHIPMGLGIFRCTEDETLPVYLSEKMYRIFGENNKHTLFSENNPIGGLLNRNRIAAGTSGEQVFPYVRPDGKHIWIKAAYSTVEEDGATMVYTVISDISEQIESRKQEAVRDQMYQVLIGEVNVTIFSYSPDIDELTYYQGSDDGEPHPVTLSGVTKDISVFSTLCEEDRLGFVDVLKKLSDAESTETIIVKMLVGGYPRRNKAIFRSICDEDGIVFRIVGKLEDVEDEMARIEEIQSRAMYDSLCVDIYNKATTEELIKNELKRSTSGALLMIDVDDFKSINDRFGHIFGDEFLKMFATTVKAVFRDSDIVGRYGGDEYFVFVPHATAALAEKKGNQILKKVSQINIPQLDGIKSSIGISIANPDNRDYRQLLKQADSALYQAKNRGKNCVVLFDANLMNEITYRTEEAVKKGRDVVLSANPNGAVPLIMRIFSLLYSGTDLNACINQALRFVGENFDVSRVYIFEDSEDGAYCSNTFEWCAKGVAPEIDMLQNVSYEEDLGGHYRENMNDEGIFYCRDISELDEPTRAILEPQGIKSMLQCAILDNGEFKGFVGFDECRENRFWTQEQIDSLVFLSKVLSVFLIKNRREQLN